MPRAMRRSAQPPAVTKRQAAALIAKYGRGRQGDPHSCGVEKTGRRALVDELIESQVSHGRITEMLLGEYPGTYITVRIVQHHAKKLCACYRPR